jgi:hypothetical protein
MTPGEATPRGVAERWARGARALHKADKAYARQVIGFLGNGPAKDESSLPADPLEEALIRLFSGVMKELIKKQPVDTPEN